eukprot:jgi/Bigna1/78686/fgenesh1_pg.56_\
MRASNLATVSRGGYFLSIILGITAAGNRPFAIGGVSWPRSSLPRVAPSPAACPSADPLRCHDHNRRLRYSSISPFNIAPVVDRYEHRKPIPHTNAAVLPPTAESPLDNEETEKAASPSTPAAYYSPALLFRRKKRWLRTPLHVVSASAAATPDADADADAFRSKFEKIASNMIKYQPPPSSPSLIDRLNKVVDKGVGSVLLILTALASLVLANNPATSAAWMAFWDTTVGPMLGAHQLSWKGWINEGLMAIFFFTVGLEIKKEVCKCSSSRGSNGGMIAPILFYLAVNILPGGNLQGWSIPMATDIAFAMGVFSFFKNRMPPSVSPFLLTLATVDDLGAILVIAVCFASHINLPYLMAASAITAALNILGRRMSTKLVSYGVLGVALWYTLLLSGVNADIAGVVTAMAIPATRGMRYTKNPRKRRAIGFTMSLFLTEAALTGVAAQSAKIGIFISSLLAVIGGSIYMRSFPIFDPNKMLFTDTERKKNGGSGPEEHNSDLNSTNSTAVQKDDHGDAPPSVAAS